jgi:rhamnosyltransferase
MMQFEQALVGSVTVWYNPVPAFLENIRSYSAYAGCLIVVDNSSGDNRDLFEKIDSTNKVYISNAENMGIAKAFNQGLLTLIDKGYKYTFTFDQDSSFERAEIEKMLQAAGKLDWEDVGILSPIHLQQKSIRVYNPEEFTPVTCVMASGNLLNLAIAQKAGFFNQQLFIDHVDNEYCLRLHKQGYKVLMANAFLIHELGNYKSVYFLGKRVGGFISHSPQRLYYFVRNSIYILKNYFFIDIKYSLSEVSALAKRFAKLFLEGDTKTRLKLYLRGIRDSGKLN